MALRIGKIYIENIDDEKELENHGIYYLGENLDQIIENKISLDYEFLIIDGSKESIFINTIKYLFSKTEGPFPIELDDLKELIRLELDQQFNESESIKTSFTWISRIMERLPGRILIIGDENIAKKTKPANWDDIGNLTPIQQWLRKRIAWISQVEDFSIEIKEEGELKPLFGSDELKKYGPDYLILSIYNSWTKNYWSKEDNHEIKGYNFEVELSFRGTENQKVTFDFIAEKKWEIQYKLLSELTLINKEKIETSCLLPFYCPDNLLPENDAINWQKECLNNKDMILNNLNTNALKRSEISKDCYIDMCRHFISRGDKMIKEKCSKIFETIFTDNSNERPFPIPPIFVESSQKKLSKELNIKESSGTGNVKLRYHRHDPPKLEDLAHDFSPRPDKPYFYQECLTGASVHFSLLNSVFSMYNKVNQAMMYFNMVENGALRILIADERIANYVSNNKKTKNGFTCSGITIVEDIDKIVEKRGEMVDLFDISPGGQFEEIKAVVKSKQFDIFIIHQGIIDKLKVSCIEDIINKWKQDYFSYVIITSGRGTPADVPSNARFIPFSILESNLITQNFSKFILTKSIFKSLGRVE